MWDQISPTEGDRRLKELRDTMWKEMLDGGAQERALRQNSDDANTFDANRPNIRCVRDAMHAIFSSVPYSSHHYLHSSRTAIQDELQQGKKALSTNAAHVLYKDAEKRRKELKKIIGKMEAEKRAIGSQGDLKELLEKDLGNAQEELTKVTNEEAVLRKGVSSKFKVTLGLDQVLDKVRDVTSPDRHLGKR